MENKRTIRYYEQEASNNIYKLEEMIRDLPDYCQSYFKSLDCSPRTKVAYAYDLATFFQFFIDKKWKEKIISEITLEDLASLATSELDDYKAFIKIHTTDEKDDKGRQLNREYSEATVQRRMASARSLFSYLAKMELIDTDRLQNISLPAKKKKDNIVRLNDREVDLLMDSVEYYQPTNHEAKAYEKNRLRDIAILTLFIGTGLRVSELVGIDIDQVDFIESQILVHRKEDKKMYVYFGDEVSDALSNYLEHRLTLKALPGHENALFLSIQGKRIGVRAVENIVEKYMKNVPTTDRISCHKLRATFATRLYENSEDIYATSKSLGHANIEITSSAYAALTDDRLRQTVKNSVRIRSDNK